MLESQLMKKIPEGTLILKEKTTVARETFLLCFECKDFPSFKAGQFISLKFGEKSWRAYSIASCPTDKEIHLVVRLVEGGVASAVFASCKVGDEFTYRGPYGMFVLSEDPAPHTIFCATGTGIAPIWSMIQEEIQKENPRSMELWYGGRNAKDIAYIPEILACKQVITHLSFSQEIEDLPGAEAGRITQFIHRDIPEGTSFYICGNGNMVKSVEFELLEKGIDKKAIHKERFN